MLQAELQERKQERNQELNKTMSGETKTLTGTDTINEIGQTAPSVPQRASQQVIRVTYTSTRIKNWFIGDEKEINGHEFRLTAEGGFAMEYHKSIE